MNILISSLSWVFIYLSRAYLTLHELFSNISA
uniref:Uncharacterized protein n=1 Tax=Rhizophora mucronata TaxID=61149 RepID=A0A2P2MZD6_RHIMU